MIALEIPADHLDVLRNALKAQCVTYRRMLRMQGNARMREHLRGELSKTERLCDEIEIARANARITI